MLCSLYCIQGEEDLNRLRGAVSCCTRWMLKIVSHFPHTICESLFFWVPCQTPRNCVHHLLNHFVVLAYLNFPSVCHCLNDFHAWTLRKVSNSSTRLCFFHREYMSWPLHTCTFLSCHAFDMSLAWVKRSSKKKFHWGPCSESSFCWASSSFSGQKQGTNGLSTTLLGLDLTCLRSL